MPDTILVVEDEETLGQSITSKLEQSGFTVYWAQNSEDAFEALSNQGIKLVFLDILLPGGMDGFDILRRMKAEDSLKKIPVVVLSNLGEMDHIDRAMELGATDYIVKVSASLSKIVEFAQKQLQLKEAKQSIESGEPTTGHG